MSHAGNATVSTVKAIRGGVRTLGAALLLSLGHLALSPVPVSAEPPPHAKTSNPKAHGRKSAPPPAHAPAYGYRAQQARDKQRIAAEKARVKLEEKREKAAQKHSRYHSKAAQKSEKSRVRSGQRSGDLDRDGILNHRDSDIDGDGVRNTRDRYPNDARRS